MSDRELTRLRVMIDLADDRLTIDAATALTGPGRRQIYASAGRFRRMALPAWNRATRPAEQPQTWRDLSGPRC